MEMVSWGKSPSGHQVACWGAATLYGFINPFLGIAAGFVCLWAE
jgi:hypothetical protein